MRPFFVALSLLAALGCTRGRDGASIDDVKRDVKKAVDTTEKYLDEARKDAQARISEQLRELDVDLDAWKAKLKQAAPEDRPALEKQVNALEKQRTDLGKQVDEMREHPGETWDRARERVDQTMANLKKSLGDAAEKFKRQ